VATAIKLARELEPYDIGWFQEAVSPDADRGLLSVEIYEVFLDEARLLWSKHD
jgi:L-alanine-DL-glutamate epimerase-like enolase superfamily enzyme